MQISDYCPPSCSGHSYPRIRVQEKNCTYARYLLDNVGGHNSEMTAISFYFASGLRLEPELAHIFQEICEVEMKHMQIFGELARCLGETTLLWTNCGGRKVWWSPSFTDYPGSISGIIDASLQGERAAIEKYQWQLDRIDDIYVQSNLRRIIEDEEIHVRIFEYLERYYKEGMMP